MAKSSRQTFKKRQRELAKKQKKEDKARRLAARRGNGVEEEKPSVQCFEPAPSAGGKPALKIYRAGAAPSK